MAKKGEISGYEIQKKTKPTARFIMDHFTNEELRETGIGLLDYFTGLRSTPLWYASNSFDVFYKSKRVCRLRIVPCNWEFNGGNPDNLRVDIYLPDKQTIEINLGDIDDVERQLYFDGMNPCIHCCVRCSPGIIVNIGGVLSEEICHHKLTYINPALKYLHIFKKLIELRRQDITDGRIW